MADRHLARRPLLRSFERPHHEFARRNHNEFRRKRGIAEHRKIRQMTIAAWCKRSPPSPLMLRPVRRALKLGAIYLCAIKPRFRDSRTIESAPLEIGTGEVAALQTATRHVDP